MTLQTRLSDLITAIGTDIKGLLTTRGTMASLTTTEKTNLVGALNELKDLIDGISGGGAEIDDDNTASGTTWSSSKISTQISAAITALVDGAPGALDTLNEIAEQLGDDESAISGLLTAVGNRVSYADAQSLDATQKAQANANIGSLSLANAGDPDTDLVALYTTAKS